MNSQNITDISEEYKSRQSSANRRNNNDINYNMLITTGTYLTEVVRKMDKCFSAMISITFMSCWIGSLTSLYLLSSIFSHSINKRDINFYGIHLTLLFTLCILRVFDLVQSTKRLGNRIKKVVCKLQRIERSRIQNYELKMLRKNMEKLSNSPLTLFSTYNLNISTMICMLLTCMISLILLIQLTGQNNVSAIDVDLSLNNRRSKIIEGISNSLQKFLCDRKWYCK